ncbi:hypothetical protein bcere0001_11320 [Bacillus cereus m1293]|nr:hypothetical protein bcere0001_11320 [Bacillus cereus m1293]
MVNGFIGNFRIFNLKEKPYSSKVTFLHSIVTDLLKRSLR